MAKYDVCKGGGVRENQTNADKGGGGVKKAEKSAYVLNGSPLTVVVRS